MYCNSLELLKAKRRDSHHRSWISDVYGNQISPVELNVSAECWLYMRRLLLSVSAITNGAWGRELKEKWWSFVDDRYDSLKSKTDYLKFGFGNSYQLRFYELYTKYYYFGCFISLSHSDNLMILMNTSITWIQFGINQVSEQKPSKNDYIFYSIKQF